MEMKEDLERLVRALAFDGAKAFVKAFLSLVLMTFLIPMIMTSFDLLKGGSVHEALNVGLETFLLIWVFILLICVTVVVGYRMWMATKNISAAVPVSTNAETQVFSTSLSRETKSATKEDDLESLIGSWIVTNNIGPGYMGVWTFFRDRTVTMKAFTEDGQPSHSGPGKWTLESARVHVVWDRFFQLDGKTRCHDELTRPLSTTGIYGDSWDPDHPIRRWRAVKLCGELIC